LEVQALAIAEVKVLKPAKYGDHRGYFSETYNRKTLQEAGIDLDFVQDNQSYSPQAGTLRGLHFQSPPCAQDKLVRVSRGRILDVAVDLRHGSPNYGKHVSAEISAAEWNQLLVPAGFAHGFLTLEPDTEVLYKVTAFYSPTNDFGVVWNDPALAIQWPWSAEKMILSDKDRRHPMLDDLPPYFHYRA
jgi:dTDP-4-dehydrorhamnose 3,5-epimerase